MNYYLVDYENIGGDALKNLSGINVGDTIIMLYSERCKNMMKVDFKLIIIYYL